jgi:hypothetical protein
MEEKETERAFGMEESRNPFLWNTIAGKQFHGNEKIQSDPLFCFPSLKPKAARVN